MCPRPLLMILNEGVVKSAKSRKETFIQVKLPASFFVVEVGRGKGAILKLTDRISLQKGFSFLPVNNRILRSSLTLAA